MVAPGGNVTLLKGVCTVFNILIGSKEGPARSPSNLEFCAPAWLMFSLPVSTNLNGKGLEGPLVCACFFCFCKDSLFFLFREEMSDDSCDGVVDSSSTIFRGDPKAVRRVAPIVITAVMHKIVVLVDSFRESLDPCGGSESSCGCVVSMVVEVSQVAQFLESQCVLWCKYLNLATSFASRTLYQAKDMQYK